MDIAKRLGEAPALCGELVRKRAEISDTLHKNLDSMKEREVQVAGAVASERNGDGKPAYPNEQARAAEIARRLNADTGYQFVKGEADRLRQELRELDARIEETGRRHRSDANMAYLVASLLSSRLKEDAEAVLEAYAEGAVPAPAPAEEQGERGEPVDGQPNGKTPPPHEQDGLEVGTFQVLEARQGRSKDTIRAYVQGALGKAVLYAKNGVGQVLASSVGKTIEAKYRRLDRGLFAVQVRPVA